jgi:hypothetical protein
MCLVTIPHSSIPTSLRQPNFALLLVIAWLLVAFQLLAQHWADTALTLHDTDDAMRLAQMRAFLAGQGWFDLHEARVQPPLGYDSHWSRLIDLGLCALFLVCALFADPALAERLMRTVWPLLWLLPTLIGMVAIAWRIAGREAALVALLLAILGLPAYQQFPPGRIDHHNVQIALSLLALAATVWSDRLRWCACAAGALTGLALGIGLECLPYLAACGAAFALRYLFDRTAAEALRAYGLSLAAATSAAFLVSVGPAHWNARVCDAIAINLVAGVVAGSLQLALAGALPSARIAVRAAWVASAGATALAVLLMLEPRCLGGPYAMMDPAVWPIWLAEVREMQPLARVLHTAPLTGMAIATFPAVALAAMLVLARDMRRDFAFLATSAAFVLACATTLAAIKTFSYAMWLGMPLVAALALRLFAALQLRSLAIRFAAALLMTPAALSAGVISIANAAGFDDKEDFARPERQACLRIANYAPLARLPAGLVLTDIDYGPALLALTPHAVLAAPYHRLSPGILMAHRALSAPPQAARALVAASRADYVMTCGPRGPVGLSDAERSASLWGRLQAGAVPDWLTLEATDGPFRVYRARAAR